MAAWGRMGSETAVAAWGRMGLDRIGAIFKNNLQERFCKHGFESGHDLFTAVVLTCTIFLGATRFQILCNSTGLDLIIFSRGT